MPSVLTLRPLPCPLQEASHGIKVRLDLRLGLLIARVQHHFRDRLVCLDLLCFGLPAIFPESMSPALASFACFAMAPRKMPIREMSGGATVSSSIVSSSASPCLLLNAFSMAPFSAVTKVSGKLAEKTSMAATNAAQHRCNVSSAAKSQELTTEDPNPSSCTPFASSRGQPQSPAAFGR